MRLKDVEQDLPILMFYYDPVIRKLERRPTRTNRKLSRRLVMKEFLKTKSFVATARRFGVSPASINDIVRQAFRFAREMAGLKFIPEDQEDSIPE